MHSARPLITLALLCALIIGASFYTSAVLSNDAKKLEDEINAIEESINKADWASAENGLMTIQEEWPKVENTWAILLDHIEIDNIDTSLLRMSKYVETKNVSMAISEISVLRQFVKHIPEKESFSIKNVF